MPYLLKIQPAKDGVHKYNALFKINGEYKTVPFGQRGASDLTIHNQPLRMRNYLARHKPRENWNDPLSAGALSRWILWSANSLKEGVANYKKHFGMLKGGIASSTAPTNGSKEEQEKDDEILEYPLSDSDIKKILPGINVISYPELNDMSHIDQAFDKHGRCMILYLTEDEHTGHWVCMIKKGRNVEYFDPYGGYKPDGESKWLSKEKLVELEQDYPTLSKLLSDSKYNVKNNPYKFQKERNDIATCGRHCVSRLYFKDLTLDQYKKQIDDFGTSPDEYVSAFTFRWLKQ
jgi:hypothetical protein|nr:MAG: putative cysteine protease [Lake Baikal virophage 3]